MVLRQDLRHVLFFLTITSLLITGCTVFGGGELPKNTTNETNQTQIVKNYTCPDGTVVPDLTQCPSDWCPSTCDDWNPCTDDSCSKETGYECVHISKDPCCGNGVCEPDETESSCLDDCGKCTGTCDDLNPCTLDYCNRTTMFKCIHLPYTGNAIGCCGLVGFGGRYGYSNFSLGFGVEVPDGWELDEKSRAEDGGVLLIGPRIKPSCSMEFSEKDRYSNLAYGFSLKPPEGWSSGRSKLLNSVYFSPTSGLAATIYVTSVPTLALNVARYIEQVRPKLLVARDSGNPISSLGATLRNITFSENESWIGDIPIREFVISGLSNRSGEWSSEKQRLVYLVYGGRGYEIAFVANSDVYDKLDYTIFEKVLASFRPTVAFDCPNYEYATTISIYSKPAEPTYMADDYLTEFISLSENYTDYVLLGMDNRSLGDNFAKYYEIVFVEDGFVVRKSVIFSIRKGKLYKLEFSVLRDEYDRYSDAFDSVVKSFKLIGMPESCKQQICRNGRCIVENIPDCCGNGICENKENCSSCPMDCRVCESKYPPLDAKLIFNPNEPEYYSVFNCENYLVRVRVENPFDEIMTVYSNDALRLRSLADTNCSAGKGAYVDCIATMSGAFGDAYASDTLEKSLTLYAYGGTKIEKDEIIRSKTLKFNVTYRIDWVGPYCMQFYCVPGYKLIYGSTNYTITGITEYRGDLRFGNTWCHANATRKDGGRTEIFYQRFYDQLCTVSWSKYGTKESERCATVNKKNIQIKK